MSHFLFGFIIIQFFYLSQKTPTSIMTHINEIIQCLNRPPVRKSIINTIIDTITSNPAPKASSSSFELLFFEL